MIKIVSKEFGLVVLPNYAVDHFKDLAGSGIPNYECMIHQNREIVWYKVLPLMFINSIYAFFTGAGLGSEGPSVFLGGMVGSSASKLFDETVLQVIKTCKFECGI